VNYKKLEAKIIKIMEKTPPELREEVKKMAIEAVKAKEHLKGTRK
jgi:hypothetical protein